MSNLVRVKTENGEATVGAGFAKRHNLDVLKKPATDGRGRALPAKPKADLAPAKTGYDALTIADLKAEIEKRNAVLDQDAQIPTSGNKPDLVAALEANDASQEDQ